MLLNIIGRLLYWTAWALQLTPVRYCKKRKRYVQHRQLFYKVFATLVKIALLSVDIPPAALILQISVHRLEIVDNISFVLLGQSVLWLSRVYTLMALICLTHLNYYQRRVTHLLNKILDISKMLEKSYIADTSETHTSSLLVILIVLAIIRLVLDLWSKLGVTLHLTSTVYYNTLFSLCYLGLAVYQTQLFQWRRQMVLFLNEFTENEDYRSRIEVDRLLSCLRVNYSILELQRDFYKIWNAFSFILPLLLLNFINLCNSSLSLAMHCVSILILSHISDEGRRRENQFLNQLFVASLHSTRGKSKEYTLMVYETAINRHFESLLGKIHQQLGKRYAFTMGLRFVKFATMYFLVLHANKSWKLLCGMRWRYENED